MNVFQLLGTIAIDGSKAKTELKSVGDAGKQAEKDLSFGDRVKTSFAKAEQGSKVLLASVTAFGAGVVAAVTSAVKHFGEYEQMVGGVNKLFGDSAQTVIKNAEQAYKTAGLSANAYMDTVIKFSARLLQGLGGDTVKAAEIADMAVRDMADNANTFGTSIGEIQNAYQGFAKQNYTMLDNLRLGYGGTASEMARLINDSGVLGDTVKITSKELKEIPFDVMIQAIHKVQMELNIKESFREGKSLYEIIEAYIKYLLQVK